LEEIARHLDILIVTYSIDGKMQNNVYENEIMRKNTRTQINYAVAKMAHTLYEVSTTSVPASSSSEILRSVPMYTRTVRVPGCVKRAISVCHCRIATVGSTIKVPALTAVEVEEDDEEEEEEELEVGEHICIRDASAPWARSAASHCWR
jgi:hypothetical protein